MQSLPPDLEPINCLFLGAQSHVSALYPIASDQKIEVQSSSGILVDRSRLNERDFLGLQHGLRRMPVTDEPPQRKIDPFKGQFAIPGGFVHQDEDIDQAARSVRKPASEMCTLNSFILSAIQSATRETVVSRVFRTFDLPWRIGKLLLVV